MRPDNPQPGRMAPHTHQEKDMQNMSREELLSLLDDIRERVATGDSFEGKLHYLLGTDAATPFQVAALYRTGNRVGAGSTELVGIDIAPLDGAA
jgi:hypothetical protein